VLQSAASAIGASASCAGQLDSWRVRSILGAIAIYAIVAV